MERARNILTGLLTSAAQASRYGQYSCPACGKPVFLRHGNVRVAHFAHRPGVGTPECELFVPTDDVRGWSVAPTHPTSPVRPAENILPVRLLLALEPGGVTRRHSSRQWELCITLPKSPNPHGQISFNCGGGVYRKVSLSTLALGPKTYPVDLDAADFAATWISYEVYRPYAAVIQRRVPGLRRGKVTAFNATSEKYKPRAESLSWGATYYFVWRDRLSPTLPDWLSPHLLAARREWRCALVSLPSEGDDTSLAWFRDVADLDVVPERRRWCIVSPVPYDLDLDGRVQLGADEWTCLAFHPGDSDEDSTVVVNAGGEDCTLIISGRRWHLLEVAAEGQARRSPLRFRWDLHDLPMLIRRPLEPHPVAVVALEFKSASQDGSRAALHEAKGRELLDSVRAGERELAGLYLPQGVRAMFRWRRQAEFTGQGLELAAALTDGSLASSTVSAINAALRDRSMTVLLDAGSFGSYVSGGQGPLTTATSLPRPLAKRTRRHVVWFCKVVGVWQTTEGTPIDRLTDAELADHFFSLKVKGALVSHWRGIAREIRLTMEKSA